MSKDEMNNEILSNSDNENNQGQVANENFRDQKEASVETKSYENSGSENTSENSEKTAENKIIGRLNDLEQMVNIYKELHDENRAKEIMDELLSLSNELREKGEKEHSRIAIQKAQELFDFYNQNDAMEKSSQENVAKMIDKFKE